jgi:glycerol kinase
MSSDKDYGPVVAAIDQGTTSTRFMVTSSFLKFKISRIVSKFNFQLFSCATGESIDEAAHQIPFSPHEPQQG